MGKPARERALKDNEARAVTRLMRVSPQKLNLLAQLIRGKKVERALADLTFSRKRVAKDVKKTLESAIANAENNHSLDVDALVVAVAYCDIIWFINGMGRRARGRAARIEKPFAQITVVLRQVEEPA
jgi:large subunit ribosomal protein L22